MLARGIVALRWPVLAAWLAAIVAAWVLLPTIGEDATPVGDILPSDSAALATQQRAVELFGVPAGSDIAVVQRRPGGLTRADVRAHVRTAVVNRALPVIDQPLPGVRWGETRTTMVDFLFVDPSLSLDARRDAATSYMRALGVAPGGTLGITGAGPARLAQFAQIEDVLPWITLATIGVILLITALYFRSLGAPLVTLATSGIAYVVAVRGAAWLSQRAGVHVPREIEPLLVVLLLGLATDYGVFLMADARRRMLAGDDRLAAARGAARHIGPTVLTAGSIVAACSLGLLVARLDFFRVFGPGLAFCALVVTLVSVTFVTAALAAFGPWLFGRRAREAEGTGRAAEPPAPRVSAASPWGARRARLRRRLAGFGGTVRAARREARRTGGHTATHLLPRLLAARPVALLVALATVAALLWGASHARGVRLAVDPIGGLPKDDPVRIAGDAAERGFAPGILAPTDVVLEGRGVARGGGVERLRAAIARRPGIVTAVGPDAGRVLTALSDARNPFVARGGDAARIVVVLRHGATTGAGLQDFRALRDDLPALARRAGLPGGVRIALAGESALGAETVQAIRGDLLRIAIAVGVVTLLLLCVFLRALVAPLLLLAAGGLAYIAALGLSVLVVGDHQIGYFVPLVGAVLLVALGSDYNTLLAGRVRAESLRRRPREAIAVAVPQASRAITVAGVTLAASFALLALVPIRPFRELALLLAVGVLVDALVVRPVLVPSLLALAGDGAWWPGPARRSADMEVVLERVRARTGLPDDEARHAACATLAVLGERIGGRQARALSAHLPPALATVVDEARADAPFDAEEFIQRVAERRGIGGEEAHVEAAAVLATLRELLPATELDYVRAALSPDYTPLVDGDRGVTA